ncbi:MAG: pimeloyl-ACP methyl ester carboxylesterase [Gammaproteobacteria bacterium]|jgi:pimeloyl-ACP methyl ester carboxylesterase
MAYSGSQRKRVIPLQYQIFGIVLNVMSYVHRAFTAKIASNLWFTVFKSKPKPWVVNFWQSADQRVEIEVNHQQIPVYSWGRGPLIVVMHGWSGSGTQFSWLIPALVESGYQVASFDAPAHGINPGNQSDLIQFTESLLVIEQKLGAIDTLIAHSLGAMASIYAIQRGLKADRLVLFGPHLSVAEMFETYTGLLNLNSKLSGAFFHNIGLRMKDLMGGSDPWLHFTPEQLLADLGIKGMLVFDQQDEEVSLEQFKAIEKLWVDCQSVETSGLGHNGILKDKDVINKVVGFLELKAVSVC